MRTAARCAVLVRASIVDLWHAGRLRASTALADRVFLLEVGSGGGRFGFLFVSAVARLRWPRGLAFIARQLTVVMSDVVPANIAAWRAVPALEA